MQQTIPISDIELEALATRAVGSVYSMMLNEDASQITTTRIDETTGPGGAPSLSLQPSETLIAGSVGFIGKIRGVLYIFMGLSLAEKITGGLLGLDASDLEREENETVNDAIGELTNIIAGAFKTDLNNNGCDCRMTIPSILRGSNYSIESTESALRRTFKIDCDGDTFVIDIIMEEEL